VYTFKCALDPEYLNPNSIYRLYIRIHVPDLPTWITSKVDKLAWIQI